MILFFRPSQVGINNLKERFIKLFSLNMSHKRFLITVDDSCVPTILFFVLLSNGSHYGISTESSFVSCFMSVGQKLPV